MRSCEYLLVEGSSVERRTSPICKSGIRFWRNHKLVPHHDPAICDAHSVTLTFEFQKNDLRGRDITLWWTDDPLMCPIKAAAKIVFRLEQLRLRGLADENSPIYLYPHPSGGTGNVGTKFALKWLRTFVQFKADWQNLGFHYEEIGLHSIRSTAAMCMYMNGVPVCTLMLIGRWSSDAFLRYIRPQVEEFGSDVARRMIETARWHHVPDPDFNDPRTRRTGPGFGHSGMGANRLPTIHSSFDPWGAGMANSVVPLPARIANPPAPLPGPPGPGPN
jgi:hypothetical protein